jgi:hypothetical protein
MEPGVRIRRVLWSAVIFLVFIGSAVAVRRMVHVVPMALHGYRPPPPVSNPVAAQFSGLDEIFARHPVLTVIHIVPGLLFMLLGPLQFSSAIRARHLRWHRWSGRIFVACGFVIGISALIMSFGMPAIGGDWRRESSGRDHFIRILFLGGAVQGVLAYPSARSCAAPRVDDSRILDWVGGGNYSADYGDIFCDQPVVRADAEGILWHRILDWYYAASDGCRGLDSGDTITAKGIRGGTRNTYSEERFLHCVSRLLRRSEEEAEAAAYFGRNDS